MTTIKAIAEIIGLIILCVVISYFSGDDLD